MAVLLYILVILGALIVIASGIWVGMTLATFISRKKTPSKRPASQERDPAGL